MKECVICGSNEFKINSDRFCSQRCIHKHGSLRAANARIECPICHKRVVKSGYNKHLNSHKKEENIHYFCENCGKEVFEKYGSGRFCSKTLLPTKIYKIKIKEIKNTGYTPYIIKDMGKHNKEFVEKEFNKFVNWACSSVG